MKKQQQLDELLKIINDDIISANIKQRTYELARIIYKDIDPNVTHRNIMRGLCNGITSSDIEFAKFWLSLDFVVPLDLACENGYRYLSNAACSNTKMFRTILDSEPGARFSSSEQNMFHIASMSTFRVENLEIFICHAPTTLLLRFRQPFGVHFGVHNIGPMLEFVSDPSKYRSRLRKRYGYNHVDAVQLFCIVLLLENKFLA